MNGVVYMLKRKDDDNDEYIYIGSTFDEKQRIRVHRNNSKNNPTEYKKMHPLICKYLEKIGDKDLDEWTFVKLKEDKFEDKEALRKLEQYYITNLKPKLNKATAYNDKYCNVCEIYISHRNIVRHMKTHEETPEEKEQRLKERRDKTNKDEERERLLKWRSENREHVNKQAKEYREKKRELVNERNRQPKKCPHCELEVNKSGLARHIKRKHS